MFRFHRSKTLQLPSGEAWLHEIKHDGFRVIARKDGDRVKLYSRPGNDLTYRFPLIVEALKRLRHAPASSTARGRLGQKEVAMTARQETEL